MQHWTTISRSLAFVVIASVLIVGASSVADYDWSRTLAGFDWNRTIADFDWSRAVVDSIV